MSDKAKDIATRYHLAGNEEDKQAVVKEIYALGSGVLASQVAKYIQPEDQATYCRLASQAFNDTFQFSSNP